MSKPKGVQAFGGRATTLLEMVECNAERFAGRTAAVFLDADGNAAETLTWSELFARARAIAAVMQAEGEPGDRAILLYPQGIDFVAAFLACGIAGMVAVPIPAPVRARLKRAVDRIADTARDCDARFVLADAGLVSAAAVDAPDLFERHSWIATDDVPLQAAGDWKRPDFGPEWLALLQYTSGSTSHPKGVMVSHGNLLANEASIRDAFRQDGESRILSWLPHYHDMGLIGGILQPLYLGTTCHLMSPVTFLQSPIRWLRAISDLRIDTSGGPNFAYDLCVERIPPAQRETLDLSCWKVAFNGSEPIRIDTLRRFAEAFSLSGFDRRALFPCYGLAESTLLVSGANPSGGLRTCEIDSERLQKGIVADPDGDAATSTLVASGSVPDEVEVRIVDSQTGAPCAADRVGEIWVRSESVAQGYWNRPQETEQTFGARLDGTRYLRTGDLGFRRGDELYVSGRLKDLIIIRGANHYPQDIELTVLKTSAWLRPGSGAVIADENGDGVVVLQELQPRHPDGEALDAAIAAIRQAVAAAHELAVTQVALVGFGQLPLTTSGKIRRSECARLFREGLLQVVREWPGAEALTDAPPTRTQETAEDDDGSLLTWLVRRCAVEAGAGMSAIGPDTPVRLLGIDSLKAARLAHEIEERCGRPVPMDAFFDDITLSRLAETIEAQPEARLRSDADVGGDEPDLLPMSLGQQGLWFLQRLAPGDVAYNLLFPCRFPDRVDENAMLRALREVARRHPILRSTIEDGDTPCFRVHAAEIVALDIGDADGADGREIDASIAAEARRTFDLQRSPPLRARLLRGTGSDVLLIALHHIATDLWSMEVFASALLRAYADARAGAPDVETAPLRDHRSFVDWQRDLLAGPRGDALAGYWKTRFADGLPPLDLPTDRPRGPRLSDRGARARMRIAPALAHRVRGFSAARGVTVFTTLLAAYALLLSRHSGRNDVLVGIPVHGRSRARFKDMLGYFVNMTGVRTATSASATVAAFVEQVHAEVAGALNHADYPFVRAVQDLDPGAALGGRPPFQASFALQSSRSLDPAALAAFVLGGPPAQVVIEGVAFEALPPPTPPPPFELAMTLIDDGDGIDGVVHYASDLFEGATVERMLAHYVRVLAQVVADPQVALGRLSLLDEAARAQVLEEWNATAQPLPEASVVARFAAQVRARPEAVALVEDGRSLTYAELDAASNRLAQVLRARGIGAEQRVAVALPRSAAQVQALLAVMKTGAAYVPLEPSLPAQRQAFIADDARVSLWVAENASAPAPASVPTLDWASWTAAAAEASADAPAATIDPAQLAYVIYTSGSTGTPKGVAVPQRGLCNLLGWHQHRYGLGPQDRCTLLAGLGFDASAWELWPALTAGAQVHPVPEAARMDPARLHGFLVERGITQAFVPTVLVEPLLDRDWSGSALRVLLTGGDALQVRPPQGLPFALVNHYGPTESSVVTTAGEVRPGSGTPSIGGPIANTRVYLLDAGMGPVPVGVPGELYIGGTGLARGYLGRPALTAERFVPDPYATVPGERLYRTGDLARFAADGSIEFLGRLDHQVKLRGFRIELGEIEAVLLQQPGVRDALVLLREDVPGDARLVGYVVGDAAALAPEAVLAALAARLPEYMLPAALVVLEAFPLTANGKLDRKALPAPALRRAERVAPATPTEELLAAVFARLLGLEAVWRDDHFFQLGGHSLLATQLVSRIREAFAVELPLRAVFEAPTLAALAAKIDAGQRGAEETIAPVDRSGPLPLSYAQERLWFLDRLDPGKATYNVPVGLRLEGPLDEAALGAAIAGVIARHEILRSRIRAGDAGPQLVVEDWPDWRWEVETLDGPAGEREARARQIAQAEAMRPFDLAHGPLVRVRLVRLGAEDALLLLTFHHIVSDGWSLNVLLAEVSQLYADAQAGRAPSLPALPIQYVDYAAWQRAYLGAGAEARQLAYWKAQLAEAPTMLALPLDRPRPPVQAFRGGVRGVQLPLETLRALEALARERGATLYMLLLAAFQALLARYTGQEDILVGSPIAGRAVRATEPLIGFFVNTLVLRARPRPGQSFAAFLAQVRETALEAYAHQDVPFERLVEEIQPERSLSHTPLFQVMFALQAASELPGAATTALGADDGDGLRLRPVGVESAIAKFDQSWTALVDGEGLRLAVEYDRDLFEGATVERMLAHYVRVLTQVVADPQVALGRLSLLDEAARTQVLEEWNATAQPLPEASVVARFAAQVRARPEAVALVEDGRSLTYAELDAASNRLAQVLRARGIGAEQRVAVALPRSAAQVQALLAVMKTGAAYVPLEPSLPAQRQAFIADDARVSLWVAENASVPAPASVPTLDWASWTEAAAEAAADAPAATIDPAQLAYVIYTSGSTGTPKGVAVPQRGLCNLLGWHQHRYGLGPQDRCTLLAGLGFDASAWELWPALTAGAQVHPVPEAARMDPARLHGFLVERGITQAFVPTVLVEPLLDRDWSGSALRVLLTGGDALQVRPPQGLPFALVNHYGPTESSVVTTAGEVRPGSGAPSIGRPIANTRVYLLDAGMGPVPVGVPGELYIGGTGLARGYLGRPALTAERFVPDPYATAPGERLYRTGDLARFAADGSIEFLGRLDHQVKLRGFRIELGEIEAVLLQQPGVRDALVLLREDVPGDARLVGYVVGDAAALAPETVLAALAARLPEYMLPAALVVLEAFPLTANGKLDRKALPAPALRRAERVAPATPTEELLAAVFARLLGLEAVWRDDHFFQLGGHSLLATQLVSRIREAFAVELPLRAVFEAPTLAALAAKIDAGQRGAEETIAPVDRSGPLPLSYAQERLWFLEQLQPGSPVYHMAGTVVFDGALDVDALAWSLEHLVTRHEALRTTFRIEAGHAYQSIAPGGDCGLQRIDLSDGDPDERERRFRALASAETERPFDLIRGPMLRATLFRMAEQRHHLLLVMHHIVSDGWSVGVMTREIAVAYAARVQGALPALPALPVQYADFSAWQREWLRGERLEAQRRYWRERFRVPPPALQLRTDRPRGPMQTFAGSRIGVRLPRPLCERLRAVSVELGATTFMVLLAGLYAVLHRATGQSDLVVGTLIANRNRREIEGLIGFFINALALRIDLSGDLDFSTLVARVRDTTLGAYAHQDLPFEKVVEDVQPERDLSRTPLFQIMLVLQNTPATPVSLPGLDVRAERFDIDASAFDISMMLDDGEDISGTIEFNSDLFDAATISDFFDQYTVLLEAALAEPGRALRAIPVLSSAARERILVDWNQTATPHPLDRCFHELFEARVRTMPDAPAASSATGTLSYAELNRRANRVAHALLDRKMTPERVVAVYGRRSTDFLATMLGIFKAGGCYLPLDPAHPPARLRQILGQAGAAFVVASPDSRDGALEAAIEGMDLALRPHVLDMRDIAEAGGAETDPGLAVAPDQLAYVIFTSGSTGLPKGAMIHHAGMLNHLHVKVDELAIDSADVVAQTASQCFDISVWQFLSPLMSGGRVHVYDEDAVRDPARLLAVTAEAGITILELVPSMLREVVAEVAAARSPHPLPRLRWMMATGEALPPDIVRGWLALYPRKPVVNAYGPTECSDDVTHHFIHAPPDERADTVPIGRAVGNTRLYILDPDLQPLPAGAVGRLYVGGAGVGRGYLRAPARTAQVFLPDPFADRAGARLYDTGDLARHLPDGSIEFLGRVDHQVKIRGFRIELGEIESALLRLPEVHQAVVTAFRGADGVDQLAAYFEPREADPEGTSTAAEAVQRHLAHWQAAFDALHEQPDPAGELGRHALWRDTFDGSAIPSPEVMEWLDDAAQRVLAFAPRRVLQIGCGEGALLERIAPHCDDFVATDLSTGAIAALRTAVARTPALSRVRLMQRMPDDFDGIEPCSLDAVVIDSASQYFPGAAYLQDVLDGAVASVTEGGVVHLGGVRSLPLLRALHFSVARRRAEGDAGLGDLRRAVRKGIEDERELAVDPAFFLALPQRMPRISRVELRPKQCVADNEFTRYRYDVLLHVGGERATSPGQTLDWREAGGLDGLRERLRAERPASLLVRGVDDARLLTDRLALSWLDGVDDAQTLRDLDDLLHATTASATSAGVAPSDWRRFADTGYIATPHLSADGDATRYDVVLAPIGTPLASRPLPPREAAEPRPLSAFANDPLRGQIEGVAIDGIRSRLREALPDYMVPAVFVPLRSMPLTPNGKIDRRSLPDPSGFRVEQRVYAAPEGDIESAIARIWAEVLGTGRIGRDDRFFDIGGDSLKLVRVYRQLEVAFPGRITVADLFRFNTVRQLAETLGADASDKARHDEVEAFEL